MSFDYLKFVENMRSRTAAQITAVKKAKEINQYVLGLKAAGGTFEELPGCTGFSKDGVYYFSEAYVNRLMEYAYNCGRNGLGETNEISYTAGEAAAMKRVAEKLGLYTEEDLDEARENGQYEGR